MSNTMTNPEQTLRERLEALGSRIRIHRKGTHTYVRIDLAEQAVREWLESEAAERVAAKAINAHHIGASPELIATNTLEALAQSLGDSHD